MAIFRFFETAAAVRNLTLLRGRECVIVPNFTVSVKPLLSCGDLAFLKLLSSVILVFFKIQIFMVDTAVD